MPPLTDTTGHVPPHTADSLNVAADSLHIAADSFSIVFPAAADKSVVWSAEAVYGSGSYAITPPAPEVTPAMNPVNGNTGLQIIILAAFAVYCLLVYYFRDQIKICFKGLFKFKGEKKFATEHEYLYDELVNYAVPFCMITAGIMITKAVIALYPALAAAIPFGAVMLVPLAAGVTLFSVFLLQVWIIGAAGKLTFTREFTGAIIYAKKMHLTAAAILIFPAVLLFSGVNPILDVIMLYIVITEVIALSLIFAFRTMLLFIKQKVSLLVWILYLCAVEIFPVSFVTLLVVKNL